MICCSFGKILCNHNLPPCTHTFFVLRFSFKPIITVTTGLINDCSDGNFPIFFELSFCSKLCLYSTFVVLILLVRFIAERKHHHYNIIGKNICTNRPQRAGFLNQTFLTLQQIEYNSTAVPIELKK